MTEYKSVEQRIWDNVRDFSEYFARYAYGTVATPFRIPTFIRKYRSKQLVEQRTRGLMSDNHRSDNHSIGFGALAGVCFGLLAIGFLPITESVRNKNYLPLMALGVTNLASGFYELRRVAGKKRNEGLEAKVQTQ